MLQDMFQPSMEQLPIDDISSPISAQIFDFCDPELLFSDTLQNSEGTSCSNCYYEDNSLHTDMEKFNSYQDSNPNTTTTTTTTSTTTTAATTATTINNSSNLPIIFDSQDEIDNDISASIDFSPSPPFSVPQFLSTQQYQFDFSPLQPHQIPITDHAVHMDGLSVSQYAVEPLLGHPPLPSLFEEDCLSSVPSSYLPLNPSSPSCSFLGPAMAATYMPSASLPATLSVDSAGIFGGSILRSSELQLQELDFQGDNGGIFCSEMQRVLNPGDHLQVNSPPQQVLVGGPSVSTPIASEISSLEDSTFKVGKLSVEQRKEKIHRYMKKRNERNFSKKIKYACRKTLADSRPRVRGRFAKNDDFGETPRTTCSNHEEDDDDEQLVIVKQEDDMVDSSDIFAHVSGLNSFNRSYPIQSWI